MYGAYYTYGTDEADGQGGYDYANDSDMVAKIDIKDGGTAIVSTLRAVEEQRDALTAVVNTTQSDTISKYEYESDSLGLRTAVAYSGTAFDSPDPPIGQSFGYNDRNELIESERDDEWSWAYGYDSIGNRTQDAMNGSDPTYYCSNGLNQYQTLTYYYSDCPPETPDLTLDYDADGNLTEDGWHKYTWDAENRLIQVEPLSAPPPNGSKKAEFTYDYRGRRVRKVVSTWNTGTSSLQESATLSRRFLWDGWKLLLEWNGSGTLLRRYTWGLDLAAQNGSVNSLESAGTIGGLLAVRTSAPVDMVYCYDGNGNVGQLVETSQQDIWAAYEYDPYGYRLGTSWGQYFSSNPFRFSTKYYDAETEVTGATGSGLLYFGYRYYLTWLGRWISRDPIGEGGGMALFRYTRNAPTRWCDPLGQKITVHDLVARDYNWNEFGLLWNASLAPGKYFEPGETKFKINYVQTRTALVCVPIPCMCNMTLPAFLCLARWHWEPVGWIEGWYVRLVATENQVRLLPWIEGAFSAVNEMARAHEARHYEIIEAIFTPFDAAGIGYSCNLTRAVAMADAVAIVLGSIIEEAKRIQERTQSDEWDALDRPRLQQAYNDLVHRVNEARPRRQ